MKVKKWAKKARAIVVHLEGVNGADLHGIHPIEIRDAKGMTIRRRVLEYGNKGPAMSVIMTDAKALLGKSALVIDEDSYQLTNEGRVLRATVAISAGGKRPPL
jgi:hypothetical protein